MFDKYNINIDQFFLSCRKVFDKIYLGLKDVCVLLCIYRVINKQYLIRVMLIDNSNIVRCVFEIFGMKRKFDSLLKKKVFEV